MLTRIDKRIYEVERYVVAAMLAVMGIVVFFDVVHRVSTRTDSLLANPILMAVVFSVLGALAARTRGSTHAWVVGPLIGLLFVGGQTAFVKALPNGLVWSQTLALGLTLWLGLLGASLAAYERRHLALDIGSKLWPAAIAPKVAAIGHIMTAACCVLLLWLSFRSLFGYTLDGAHVAGHVDTWRDSDGAAGTMMALPIPKWAVFASIPYGMAMLTWRFVIQAIRTWTGAEAIGGDDTLAQLGIHVEDDA